MKSSSTVFSAKRGNVYRLVLYGVLTAVLIVLGMINIPQPAGLSITFNMIPVAVAVLATGVEGGAVIGGAFGLISFLQCFGIAGYSPMGEVLVNISPFLTFVQRFVTRLMMGVLTALIYRAVRGRTKAGVSYSVAGFCAAFLNTLFFMVTLVLFFQHTEYMAGKMAGRGFLAYIIAATGINAVVEMLVSTALTGTIGAALKKAGFIA